MKPYEKYKESGVEWVGDIPKHWSKLKIGRTFRKIGSGTTPNTNTERYYKDGNINWLNTGDLNDSYITSTKKKITQIAIDEISTLKLSSIDSIVIALYGATIGKLGHLKIETTTNQACCVLSESEEIENRYLFYFLMAAKNFIISKAYGGGQPNISQDLIKQLYITAPSQQEQIAITKYLDHQTAIIDELIEKKTKQIALLKEKRQAIINETVIKGLEPTAKMKDSGIEWLGEIPESWEVIKLKWHLNFLNYKRIPIESGIRFERQGNYPYYGASGIIDYVDDYIFEGKYILIGEDGANILSRSTPLAFIAEGKFWVNNHAHILEVLGGNVDYFCYQIESNDFTPLATGSAQPKLTKDAVANIKVIVPPLIEQNVIVDFINNCSSSIDSIVDKIYIQIEKLKEYRQSLISEAVTGKIDVRTWQQ